MQATKNNKSAAHPQNIFFIGTKTGQMPTLQGNKKIIPTKIRLYSLRRLLSHLYRHLRTAAVWSLQSRNRKKNSTLKNKKQPFAKNPKKHRSNTNFGRKNKPYPKMGTHEV